MLVILGAVFGAFWGARTAKARGGVLADMAQYAAGFAIAFALAGWFVTLIVDWVT